VRVPVPRLVGAEDSSRELLRTMSAQPSRVQPGATGASERACPGCGLRMPASAVPLGDTYYNTSAECWSVFGEVLARDVAVRRWAASVWESWRDWHHTIERLVAEHAPPPPPAARR